MRKSRPIFIILVVIAIMLTGCSQSQPTSTQSEQIFVGSAKSNKYHYSTCEWALKIKPENEVTFNSSEEARNAGYIPCKVCSPP
jgi:micrococcal nuclease